MVKKSHIIAILLVLAACATAQRIRFDHQYRVGDQAVYHLSITGTKGSDPERHLTYTSAEEVIKVYSDGGAEIKFSESDCHFDIPGGGPPAAIAAEVATMRVTKLGSPNELSDSNRIRISWDGILTEGLAALKNGLLLGKSAPFKSVDPPLTNNHMRGTATLVQVKDGIATIHVVGETMLNFDAPTDYGHFDGTYTIQTKTAKLLSADFTFTDPAVRGGGVAHGVMTRVDR